MDYSFALRVGKRLSTYVGGQSTVQLLNAATGLALLRLLPKTEFAIYSVALGIQTTINMLTDIGFGSAILGLVGTKYQDKNLLGSYIKAASSIRRVLLLIVTVIAIVCVVIFRRSHIGGHGSAELTFLAITVLVTLQFQAWASYYETPLLLNNRLVAYYSPQIAAAAFRMVACFALYYTQFISSTTVIVTNTLSVMTMGLSYRFLSRAWIEVPKVLSRAHAREMVRYLLPLMPLYLWAALSGQISLFLITIFGHVGQIAEVAAAGKVGQLFLLLNSSNGILLTPFFAKTPHRLLRKRYVYVMGAVGAIALMVAASAKLFPGIYLLLLGAKYGNLGLQVQLVVYASSIGYFTGAMWSVVIARKWVFWWSGMVQVAVLALAQLICILILPINTSEGVLRMNIYICLSAVLVQVAYLIPGLLRHGNAEAAEAVI